MVVIQEKKPFFEL